MFMIIRPTKKPFVSAGVQKSADQLLTSTLSTWTLINDWAIRSGFPETIIESNGIRIPAGLTVNYTYLTTWSASGSAGTEKQSHLLLGSTEVSGSYLATPQYGTPSSVSGSFVGTGEIVTMEVRASGTTSATTITTGTYLEITKA